MKIKVINGVNLNMLGVREPNIYGKATYQDLVSSIRNYAEVAAVEVICYQSNSEGDIVTEIQTALGEYDGIIINAGAYTHTSVAILDALKAVNIPTVEVHLTDINNREEFRKFSYISLFAEKIIIGKGFQGYLEAMDYLVANYYERKR